MSPADSEGKCQCQHCDGKQSVRECLCDTVGVTSTIDFQLRARKVWKLFSETKPAIFYIYFYVEWTERKLKHKENWFAEH